ncbi:MAG: DUF488 domain-containing protein [Anaerovoracaceae bacterium]|jgi:uncharacterized protein YeaO (DUF488 family)
MGIIKWKRIYLDAEDGDGYRILVDRLWPRGVKKEKAALDMWAKDITPSADLRKAYHKGAISFEDFSEAYRKELVNTPGFHEFVSLVAEKLSQGDVTLLYASKEPQKSHIPVLREQLEEQLPAV